MPKADEIDTGAGETILQQRLRERMAGLGLNPFSTAKKAGLHPDYVRNILRGKARQPSAERLAKLAEALECSLAYLLGQPDPAVSPEAHDREGRPLAPPEPLVQVTFAGGRPGILALPIRYELITSSFRPATEIRRELGFEGASTVIAYADREQWFEVVRDDGADLVAPPGSLLQVARFSDDDRPALTDGDVVIVERHLIGPDAAYYLVERSVRIIKFRYPDLGLWFFEFAASDVEHWGISDDIFRDEKNPTVKDRHDDDFHRLAGLVQDIRDSSGKFDDSPPIPREEIAASLRQSQKLRPRVVAKVLRALAPIDTKADFGFAVRSSGSVPNSN